MNQIDDMEDSLLAFKEKMWIYIQRGTFADEKIVSVKQQQENLKTRIRDTVETIEEAVMNNPVDVTVDWKEAMEKRLKELESLIPKEVRDNRSMYICTRLTTGVILNILSGTSYMGT